jgi:hypothetical protein
VAENAQVGEGLYTLRDTCEGTFVWVQGGGVCTQRLRSLSHVQHITVDNHVILTQGAGYTWVMIITLQQSKTHFSNLIRWGGLLVEHQLTSLRFLLNRPTVWLIN